MASLSKRKAIAIENALKKDSIEPVGFTDGIQMSIEFTDVKNAKDSTSVEPPIPTTPERQEILDLPAVAVTLPDFIAELRRQDDPLFHDAADKMESLATGNARHIFLTEKYIHGIVKYNQLK
jgi:hypothetical protein